MQWIILNDAIDKVETALYLPLLKQITYFDLSKPFRTRFITQIEVYFSNTFDL